ncbi:MAG: hypothetical protein R3B64_01710 [Candidatus Paceibacterota bacterium]
MNENNPQNTKIEYFANRATRWVGSTSSLLVHTLIFIIAITLIFFHIDVDKVLLILTTAVSLEAIYLAIFIQMSVNKNTASIVSIQEDVAEIEEDIDEIAEDVAEIEEDIDEIAEDVEDIVEDVDEIAEDRFRENLKSTQEHEFDKASFDRIEKTLISIIDELNKVKENRAQKDKKLVSKKPTVKTTKKLSRKIAVKK